MDTLSSSFEMSPQGAPEQFLPPESPLPMSEQQLRIFQRGKNETRPALASVASRRALIFMGTAALTAAGCYEMYEVLQVGGVTVLEWMVLVSFVLLFAWIAFSFMSALAGFVVLLFRAKDPLGIDPDGPLPSVSGNNAMLLPTYNEDPYRIMARLRAIYESVDSCGHGSKFDWFVLSDTTNPSLWIAEEKCFLRLRRELGASNVYYRHRPENTAAEGNYWGHNAIIRVRAFAGDAGLPDLKGRKPFGGNILSHDFVEAALMRRGGWAIRMAATLGGSFEECPPSLLDFAARDRRWCQGNLQHLAVLPSRGLHWVSRLHLMTGIGSYLTAPLWLLFMALGILISLQAEFVRPEYFPKGFSLYPKWPAQDPILAAWVFAGTMGLLIVPKILAYLLLGTRSRERKKFGGGPSVLAGLAVEIFLSGLIAPVMMIFQSAAVGEILLVARRRLAGSAPRRRRNASRGVDPKVCVANLLRGRFSCQRLCGVAAAIALDDTRHCRPFAERSHGNAFVKSFRLEFKIVPHPRRDRAPTGVVSCK